MAGETYKISGIVLDFKTKKPIKDVNVYIEETSFGTITNEEGYFSLYLNNQFDNSIDLNIKMIGYKQEYIHIDLSKTKIDLGEIFLKTQLLELDIIHIHAHENKLNQISDITLSGQELNNSIRGNLATTLFNQPNIGINSFGTIASKPVLRGYSNDRFLLAKDGNKTGDLSQSSIDHAIALDMTEINRIEIIRGPRALIYGSNAIGGVINTTINGNPKVKVDKLYKKVMLGGQSFNRGMYGNIILYIPIKSNQLNISINNRKTDDQTSPIGKLENTYSTTSNYKLGFTRYNKSSYINFIIENLNMDYGIPPSSEGHINGVDIGLIKNTSQINYHQDISLYDFYQFEVKYNFIDYEHKEFENNNSSYEVALLKKTHNFKIEFESSYSIFGSELNYKRFLPKGSYLTPDTDEFELSLYGFYEKKFNNFNLLSSFRLGGVSIRPIQSLDNQEIRNRNFNYFSSSLGFMKVINNFEINTWVMNAMRPPSIEELYSKGPHLGTYSYEIGEPDLELEKTCGIESSIRYNVNPLDVSVTTFYNYSPYYYQMNKVGECGELTLEECRAEGFIKGGMGSGGWLYKYQAKGIESLIKGLEFNLNYSYQNFKIIYDFSLVRGNDLTNESYISYMNPDKQIFIVDYKKKITSYKLRFIKIHSQNRLGEFESYTQGSFLVDFILSYNTKKQNIAIQFNNIFNEEYYNHLSKIKSISPEAGRNVVLSYKIFF